MAHAFDTGLPRAQRTTVQTGAVTLLSGLLKAAGGYLQAVIPWGGVVRSWTDEIGVDLLYHALNGRAPAIAIALGDRSSSPAGQTGFHFKCELEMLVYFATNHQRDLVAGRQLIDAVGLADDTADPGLHVMMEHAEELLVGQRCGINDATIKQIRPNREEELLTRDDITIWVQTYGLTMTRSIDQYRTLSQIITSIRTRTTTEDGEVLLPNAPTKTTTIDVNTDNLGP